MLPFGKARLEKQLSDVIKIGVVVNGLEKGNFRDHLLINTSGTKQWSKFSREIEAVEFARLNSRSTPMDLSAVGHDQLPKRLEGNCSWCGVHGHMAGDCWKKAAARRKIVVRTPPEDTGCPSGFALLDKSMYGTKDAAQCFDVTCSNRGDWCRSSCGSLRSRNTW